ncbi:hypothetical protein AAFF_G00103990 [Aldrovandia affinis]|uniref:Uncharacterized protein n=1 Tax=Aldrovandia affinis TaxID=143900 RepID=A0AAD7WC36_9TELE|nr:hypothetical protein AAFF_G00103990 [Aldrovandia affinis]
MTEEAQLGVIATLKLELFRERSEWAVWGLVPGSIFDPQTSQIQWKDQERPHPHPRPQQTQLRFCAEMR